MTTIIADHRERVSKIIRQLAKEFNVEIKQLIVADYIVQTKDKDGNIFTVGI